MCTHVERHYALQRKMERAEPWVKMIPIFVPVDYATANNDMKMTC